MPVRRAKALTFRARGLTDSTDGTNAFEGSMQSLQNLIPSPTTAQQFVPRPASIQTIDFDSGNTGFQDNNGNFILDNNGNVILGSSGPFIAPTSIEVLYVVGTRVYGMVATGRFPGQSEPYCYDMSIGAFVPIVNVTAANTPLSQPTTGDWTPPTMDMIANRILITHPGYDGVTNFLGWIDISGYSYTGAATGNTNGNHTINGFASSVITLGWQVGYLISDAAGDIPPNTYITNISADGKTVTISNAATGSNSGTTFTVTGGSMASPLYGAGQTAPIGLAGIPKHVQHFNGRAYYAVLNGVTFSDSLNPTQVSGAGGTFVPTILMGDDEPVTALVGVPLANQVVGGVVQSLIAFKGAAGYWQVTGDPASNNLASNEVAGSVGTLAPNTLSPTPLGIAYMAPDGLRIIGVNGQSSQPIGADGQGISVPLEYAIYPSRAVGAYNQNVYRLSVQNGFVNNQPNQEYWYDFNLQVWTGPHTFPAALIQPTYAPAGFLAVAVGIGTSLWYSTALPSASSSYIENSQPMDFVWQPSLLPDNGGIAANSSPQGAIGFALPSGMQVGVLAVNELGQQLGAVTITGGGGTGATVWDAFSWGAAAWGAAVVPYQQYTLPWSAPLVFKQATLRVTGQSAAGFAIGNAYLQYQELGYIGSAGVVGAAA